MSRLALVTPEGLVLCDNEPPKVEKPQEDLTFHVVLAREHYRANTNKNHNFVPYSGAGCAICGNDETHPEHVVR